MEETMSLSKESIKKLRAVKAAILAEPDYYDQNVVPHSCDSPCCLLGWALWIHDRHKFDQMIENQADECQWDQAATECLGLESVLPDIYEQWRLFGSGVSWPVQFRSALSEAYGNNKRCAVVAAQRIEHFIKTGGEE